jgi:hypothetical protein
MYEEEERPLESAESSSDENASEPFLQTATSKGAPNEPPPETSGRDQPVTETVGPAGISDQPALTDSLGFTPYVQAIAAFLTHEDTKPPLTISVEGAWGSGKSSFMQQLEVGIKDCLKVKGKRGKCVRFNAWQQSKDEELWAAFALHFSDEMSKQLSWSRRLFRHLKLQWLRFNMKRAWLDLLRFSVLIAFFIYASVKVFSYVSANPASLGPLAPHPAAVADAGTKAPSPDEVLLKVILASLGGAGYILLAFIFLKKGAQVVGNPLKLDLTKFIYDPKYADRLAFIETFQSDFRKMVQCLAKDEVVFVFIDDLDRCEVPKAADLMQALNMLIADSPSIIYILGLDREKIAAGIAAKFEKVIPYLTRRSADPAAAVDFGLDYLEKFIQIPFQIPQPTTTDIDRLMQTINQDPATPNPPTKPYVEPEILFVTKVDSPLVREIVRMVAPAFDFNPRRIKQFVNCFRVQAIIAAQTGAFGPSRDAARFDKLTPEQLGKLIAMCLRWPRLVNEISEAPELLQYLQMISKDIAVSLAQEKAHYWKQKRKLLDLFSYGVEVESHDEEDEETREIVAIKVLSRSKYVMDKVDVERFLQVAPKITVRQTTTAPVGGDRVKERDINVGSSSRMPASAAEGSWHKDRAHVHVPDLEGAQEPDPKKEMPSANK